ncbi:MAG: rhodanese-like domain-containing protein [Candidatus Sericytochromatia bacterium]
MSKQFWIAALAACALSGCQAPGPAVVEAGGSPAPVVSEAPDAEPASPRYEAPRLTPQEVKARMDAGEDIVVVDVRGASFYAAGHIEGAISAPWATLSEGHAQLPKDKLLLLYCT